MSGNQLAVVHDADGLSDATMLAFARETRLSETTFVQRTTQPGADYRNRIWWPNGEMPFAGHPTIGTAVAVALRRGESSVRYVQETPAGLQPIKVELAADGAGAWASMHQEPAVFGPDLSVAPTLAAVGLQPADVHPDLPPRVVSTGVRNLLIAVRDAEVLERCAPSLDALRAALDTGGCATAYVAAIDSATGTAQARAFFHDPWGLREDPATGSAAGPLCAYMQQRLGTDAVVIEQGAAIGRPSRLTCTMDDDRVQVSGDVVIVATGDVRL